MRNQEGILLLLLMAVLIIPAYSQKTGDRELDMTLTKIDAEAKLSFNSFSLELSKTYSVSTAKIDNLRVEVGMGGGDIYMALEISRITGKSLDIVVNTYKAKKAEGWGVIAKELGIKPGSDEFHQLKGNARSKGKDKPKSKNKGKGKGNN